MRLPVRCPTFLTGGQQWTGYHVATFLLTFFSYALYHVTRKAFSNVKTSMEHAWMPYNITHFHDATVVDPADVDGNVRTPLFTKVADAESFLGLLDCTFLSAYAFVRVSCVFFLRTNTL